MAQKDWDEILKIFEQKQKGYIKKFLNSKHIFLPNKEQQNIFSTSNDFSSKDLNKTKPASWIPNYSQSTLSNYLIKNNLMPIRSGQGCFFFYKGTIFFDLKNIEFLSINKNKLQPVCEFTPLTLNVDFQRNENAYINKAVALGIVNHFINSDKVLLHGQSGVIKLTQNLDFKTSQGTKQTNSGLLFEVDMVLETEDEIVIIEAKKPTKKFTEEFSLLQLYYPLIYFSKITNNEKKIRTIFMDILVTGSKEEYRLLEIEFIDGLFNTCKVQKSFLYSS